LIRSDIIPGTIQDTGCQIAFEISAELKGLGRLCKGYKDIVHNVFRGAGVIEQSHSERKQTVQILLIDPPKGLLTAGLEFPLQHFIFDHLWFLYSIPATSPVTYITIARVVLV
jgi:hypothetical protein